MAFATLMIFQMFNVLNCRSEFNSLFKVGIFTNMKLWGAIIISILMQVLVIQTSVMEKVFNTVHLSAIDWGVVFLAASSVFIVVEIYKLAITRINPELVK